MQKKRRVTEAESSEHLPELVASAVGGDERAFSTLYDRYKAYAWGVALRTTSDRALAEEAVVDGFASAFQSLERIDDPTRFQAYLASCVRNEVLAQVKKSSRVRSAERRDAVTDSSAGGARLAEVSPESLLFGAADAELAFAALQGLDDRQQQAIYLVDIEEFSAGEAAKTLGLSTNALHQLLFRARRSLRLQFIAPALEDTAPAACRECNDSLATYVRGAARSDVSQQVENHLAVCPACQIRLESATETNQLITRAGAAIPAGLSAAVAAKVGFTLAGSTAAKTSRAAALKHLAVMYPAKTAGVMVGLAALVTAGVAVATVASPPSPSSPSPPKPLSHVAATPIRSKGAPVPSTSPAALVPPARNGVSSVTVTEPTTTATSTIPSTIPPAVVAAPIASSPPSLSSSMTSDGSSGYSATLALGMPFNATVSATSKGGSVTLTLTGPLPSGLRFTANNGVGTFSGTPTISGVTQVDITATSNTGSTKAVVTLTVSAPPVFTSSASFNAAVGSPLTFPITASGYPAPAFSVTGTLPPGLRLRNGAGGTLSIVGTPTTAGTWTVVVTASNSVAQATQTLTITVH